MEDKKYIPIHHLKHLHHHTRKIIHENKFLHTLFRFRYPKLLSLTILIIASYFIFTNPLISEKLMLVESYGNLGIFFAGILLAFGFTAPFAAGYLITLSNHSIFPAAFIGGLGALFADLIIFRFIKLSFLDEFSKIKETRIIKEIESVFDYPPLHKLKIYLAYSFIGLFIASPLPDELAVSILAGMTRIKALKLGIICFILHTIGIAVMLLI